MDQLRFQTSPYSGRQVLREHVRKHYLVWQSCSDFGIDSTGRTRYHRSSAGVEFASSWARIADDSDPNGDSGNVELNRTIAGSGSSCYVERRLLRGAHRSRQYGRKVRFGRQVDGTVVASEACLAVVVDKTQAVACCYGVPGPEVGPKTGQVGEGSSVGRYGEAVE